VYAGSTGSTILPHVEGVVNIASVSWGDHLAFGEGDGRLDTPERLARRLRAWRTDLDAEVLHWRVMRTRIPGRFFAARGYRHPSLTAARRLDWDDVIDVPRLSAEAGLEPWLYVSLFDEGWPLAPARRRAVSYHNEMHGRHVAWQSDLTRTHPDWIVTDRAGRRRQWGVVSLAYPEARQAFITRWMDVVRPTAFAGIFVCLRSQSRPADHGDQFGFNAPAREDYRRLTGHGVEAPAFDPVAWRSLLGSYLTQLLVELRASLAALGRPVRLGVGAPRGDILGPPLGNATLHWRAWVRDGLVDQLVVDQRSWQCPSMWHQLWPMHRGRGYLPGAREETLPPLLDHLASVYAPLLGRTETRLFVARQWHSRDAERERDIARVPGVRGLAFSTFRHDNPAAVARGDWHAGRI
jgi:hypothetical protein